MPFIIPLIHIIKEVFEFFTRLIDALWNKKISDLIQDLPSAKLALNLSDHEMKMTLEQFYNYQMSKPESFLKTQYNFAFQVKILWEIIEQNNKFLINLQIKQEKDAAYNELISIEDATKQMFKDLFDELEAARLAETKKLLENLYNQLNNYFANHHRLNAIDDRLNYIVNRQQEIARELNNLAEKNFTLTVDMYKIDQQMLINDLKHQLHQIDTQINVQTEKLTRAESDLVLLKEQSVPANVIVEKTTEINNLKLAISSLQDIRKDENNLLNKATEDLHSVTELTREGIASWGTPPADNVAKMAALQTGLQRNNQETVSMAKDIKTKINALQEAYPDLAKKDLSFLTEHNFDEKFTAKADKFSKDCAEINKPLDTLVEESSLLRKEEVGLLKEQAKLKTETSLLGKEIEKSIPHVQAALKKEGFPAEASQLKDLIDFHKKHPATPIIEKDAKPWIPRTFSQNEEDIKNLLLKRNKNDRNPPTPPPPRNGFSPK